MKGVQMSTFYDLFDILHTTKINCLLPYLNIKILSRLFLKLDLFKLYRIINELSVNQFIECLYFISDDKLECLKNMSSQQKLYIENLFNHVNPNLYDNYFQYFTKQIIFCLLNTNNRIIVLNNVNNINIQIVKLFVKILNFNEILIILNKFNNVDDKIELINSISDEQYQMISDSIDRDLHDNGNNNSNMINYKLINTYISLNLSKFSYNKIKQNLNIDNV
jgi:Mg/Co/Ni transporter MgtE